MNDPGPQPSHSKKLGLDAIEVTRLARSTLKAHPHFRKQHAKFKFQWHEEQLLLTGSLPSFHLKQLSQQAFRSLGISILNAIEVNPYP